MGDGTASMLIVSSSWINEGVAEVNQHVDDHETGREDQRHALHHREVAAPMAVINSLPIPGKMKICSMMTVPPRRYPSEYLTW